MKLLLPVGGLADTRKAVFVPDAVYKQPGCKLAVQAAFFLKFLAFFRQYFAQSFYFFLGPG